MQNTTMSSQRYRSQLPGASRRSRRGPPQSQPAGNADLRRLLGNNDLPAPVHQSQQVTNHIRLNAIVPLPSLDNLEQGRGGPVVLLDPLPLDGPVTLGGGNEPEVFLVDTDDTDDDVEEILDSASSADSNENSQPSSSQGSSGREVDDDDDVVLIEDSETGDEAPQPADAAEDGQQGQDNSQGNDENHVPAAVQPDNEDGPENDGDDEPMETDQAEEPPPVVMANPPVAVSHNSSLNDFKTPKKVSAAAIAAKMALAAKMASPERSDDEGECCPICFENWTTSGVHRLVSLKCGHLFGQSCIDKWLKGQGDKCPQCNKKAKRTDIRVLYAKSLKVLDTSEKDQALEALEKEKEARKKAEFEAAECRLQYQLAIGECNKLKQDLERKRQQIESLSRSVPSTSQASGSGANKNHLSQSGAKYLLDRNVEISKGGGCRVMAYSRHLGAIVVSQPSGNPMFPGFGVKKLSTLDFRSTQFVHIHSKMIRDVSFNAKSCDGLLLSCAMDKMLKITSIISNTVVQSYEATCPLWSCCWNSDNGLHIYAGLANGTVFVYDTRNTGDVLDRLNTEGTRSPVVGLQYVPKDVNANFKSSGLLVGQLNRTSFYEALPDSQHKVHMLPLEGTLTSLSFEANTRHVLASFRPSAKTPSPSVRHTVCELVSTNASHDPARSVCTSYTVHTLHGGSTMNMLSRSQLYCHPEHEEKLLVCAGDEATSSAKVWDASVGQLRQKLTSNGPVVDTCAFTGHNKHYLTALTEKSLAIYKWT